MSGGSRRRMTLATFDVDGTLIQSVGAQSNWAHKAAFAKAFSEVYNVADASINEVAHQGLTDPLVILKVLKARAENEGKEFAAAEAEAKLGRGFEVMVKHVEGCSEEEVATGLDVLPGIKNLFSVLSKREDVVIGLVTGNVEQIGWRKMKAIGLLPYFTGPPNFGGFGSDYNSGTAGIADSGAKDRAQLVRLALEKAKSLGHIPEGVELSRFHFGDTPMDVKAAENAGAHCIAVTTGAYTAEQLRASSTHGAHVFDTLEDTDTILKTMQLI